MEQLRKIQVAIDANEEITPLRVSLIETVLDDTLIIATLSKLGMDMAEVDKRLAQVEEDIKRMKSQLRT